MEWRAGCWQRLGLNVKCSIRREACAVPVGSNYYYNALRAGVLICAGEQADGECELSGRCYINTVSFLAIRWRLPPGRQLQAGFIYASIHLGREEFQKEAADHAAMSR
jgi:hypothetical protein